MDIGNVVDIGQWQRIQDLFANVIGVSLFTVSKEGKLVTRPSNTSPFCESLRCATLFGLKACLDCINQNVQMYLAHQKHEVELLCGLHSFVIPIFVDKKEIIAFIIAGPFTLGGKKKSTEYKEVADVLGIDFELYLDGLRDIKSFTYKSINSVILLLSEAIGYMTELGYQKHQLEALLPGFIKKSESTNNAYAHLYVNKLLNALLDIAIGITKADTGSVMLIDESNEELYLKLSKGLVSDGILSTRTKLGEGISGKVAEEKIGYLFSSEKEYNKLYESDLKRSEIAASIVMPIVGFSKTMGVLSINTINHNVRFNKRNIGLIKKLCDLAAIALYSFYNDEMSFNKE